VGAGSITSAAQPVRTRAPVRVADKCLAATRRGARLPSGHSLIRLARAQEDKDPDKNQDRNEPADKHPVIGPELSHCFMPFRRPDCGIVRRLLTPRTLDPAPARPLAVVVGDGEGFKEVFYRTLQAIASARRTKIRIFPGRLWFLLTPVIFFPSKDGPTTPMNLTVSPYDSHLPAPVFP
jgi:hypothetical protein